MDPVRGVLGWGLVPPAGKSASGERRAVVQFVLLFYAGSVIGAYKIVASVSTSGMPRAGDDW